MKYSCPAHRGVALVIVLWMVAALSLITAGIVQSVRTEIRVVGSQRQAAVVNALADGVILLALQSLHATQQEPRSFIQSIPVEFEGVKYDVLIQPLNGLVDINTASPRLLTELFRIAGGLPLDSAQSLARATIEFRQIKNGKGVPRGFDSTEDLLSVPQMTYFLYAKLSGLVSADLKESSGRVNPLAAPAGLLQVLAGGNAVRANDLAAKRDSNPNSMDTSLLNPEFTEITPSRSLRLQVRVDLPDGGVIQRAWLVYWGTDPRSRLPWRVLRTPGTDSSAVTLTPQQP